MNPFISIASQFMSDVVACAKREHREEPSSTFHPVCPDSSRIYLMCVDVIRERMRESKRVCERGFGFGIRV